MYRYSSPLLFILVVGSIFMGCRKTDLPAKTIYPPGIQPGSGVMDLERHFYPTIAMGNGQEWMALNLRTRHFSDGSPIEVAEPNQAWPQGRAAGYTFCPHCTVGLEVYVYDTLYGLLYNGFAATDDRNVCPSGWHVPTDKDWTDLEKFLGLKSPELTNAGWRGDQALDMADKLMLASDSLPGWPLWSGSASGSYGSRFNAVSTGSLTWDGVWALENIQTYWWTSTSQSNGKIFVRGLDAGQWGVDRNMHDRSQGHAIRCLKGDPGKKPSVTVPSVSGAIVPEGNGVFKYSATIQADVTESGSDSAVERGFIYSTHGYPSPDDRTVLVEGGSSHITAAFKGLNKDSTYHFRTFASNQWGTNVGQEFTLLVLSTQTIDADGNIYDIIRLPSGTKWMADNLRATTFSTGEAIPMLTDNEAWATTTNAAYSNYNNDTSLARTYGRLYNGFVGLDYRNACPVGWHVSTDDDWKELEASLGMPGDQLDWDSWNTGKRGSSANVANKLMSKTGWNNGANGSDQIGFRMLPAGIRSVFPGVLSGHQVVYSEVGNNAYFWTTQTSSYGYFWRRQVSSYMTPPIPIERVAGDQFNGLNQMTNGFSIRCVRK